tara:strand:+ start:687 stop:1034 length:348 start_codon:yes stop_codon:yes gene_type:complete
MATLLKFFPLAEHDVVKGAEVAVRFKMKHADGSPAPSRIYCGWITRVTNDDVVWVRFKEGKCGGGGGSHGNKTYLFNLGDMVDNIGDFSRFGPTPNWQKEDDECADTLLMFSMEM